MYILKAIISGVLLEYSFFEEEKLNNYIKLLKSQCNKLGYILEITVEEKKAINTTLIR